MMTMDGSVLEEKSPFKMLGILLCFDLNCGSYNFSIASVKKKEPLYGLSNFSLLDYSYLLKSTNSHCIKYCFNVWPGVHNCYCKQCAVGYQPFHSKPPSPCFLPSPFLNLEIAQALPLFRQTPYPLIYWLSMKPPPPPPKNLIFK